MPNHLQKYSRKHSLRIDIDAHIFTAIHHFWRRELSDFSSFSSFTEAAVFLVEGMWVAEADDGFIFHLRDLKAQRLLSLKDLRKPPATRELHMTVSQPILEYLDHLRKSYPVVFGSRAEVLNLIYLAILETRDCSDNAAYLRRRLLEAAKNYGAKTII